MKSESSQSEASSNLVDLGPFRKKKILEKEIARGRNPLFVSHDRGTISNSHHPAADQKTADMGDRLQRIRTSLQKINQLMGELKKMSADNQKTTH